MNGSHSKYSFIIVSFKKKFSYLHCLIKVKHGFLNNKIKNPYESFIKRHLEHYGYFTGRNMTIAKFGYEPKRTPTAMDSDESNSDSDDSDSSLNRLESNYLLALGIQSLFFHYISTCLI